MENGNKILLTIGIIFIAALIYNPSIFSIYSVGPNTYSEANNSIIQNWYWDDRFNDTLILKTEISEANAGYYCFNYSINDYSFLKLINSVDTLIIPDNCKLENNSISLKIILSPNATYSGSTILFEETTPEVNETNISSSADTETSSGVSSYFYTEESEQATESEEETPEIPAPKKNYLVYAIIGALVIGIGFIIYRSRK